jgi:hypothetical protein
MLYRRLRFRKHACGFTIADRATHVVSKTMTAFRNVAAAILALALLAGGAAQAREPILIQMLKGTGDWLRVNLVGGRLVLKVTQISDFENRADFGGVTERFRLHSDNGRPSLTYERTTRDERLTFNLSASAGQGVCIRREPREKSKIVAVEFKQSLKEKTTLTIGSGDRKQVFRAADLWRLAIDQPKQCEQHLFPLLAMLRRDWNCAEMASTVELHLLEEAREDPTAAHAHWATLVEQLDDDSFAKREAADRALRAGGPAALKYLRQLDFSRLDAEQQFRVHRIIEALAGTPEDDSPTQVAASLAGDPMVWLSLLGRPNAATRRTAAEQLAALLGEPLKLDPAADPDTQKQQREQLRERIAKEQSAAGADAKKDASSSRSP